MKSNPIKAILLVVVTLGTFLPVDAEARDHRRYRHHHHYGSRRSVVVVNPVYVEPRPVYVTPRPVYVAPAPVVVEQPVIYGNSVEVSVQRALAKRGYYGGVIDGDVGPRTRASIRAYQVDKGLPVTGVIDGRLLKSLRLL